MLIGAWRGLVFEMLTLTGWVAAFVLAQWLAADVGAWLPMGERDAPWRYAAGFILIFVAVAFGAGLLAALLRRLVKAAGLRPVDRTLGAAFGLARGVLALLVVAVVVHVMAWRGADWWRTSHSAELLDTVLRGAKPVLPEPLASHLP